MVDQVEIELQSFLRMFIIGWHFLKGRKNALKKGISTFIFCVHAIQSKGPFQKSFRTRDIKPCFILGSKRWTTYDFFEIILYFDAIFN